MNDMHSSGEPISSPQSEHDALRYVADETPCPYLPARRSRNEAYFVEQLDGRLYERLLGRGFRRSGRLIYRPRCRGCRECQPLRVTVDRFSPTRSMRRVWRRNGDVNVQVGRLVATEEKFVLFRRYLDYQHDGAMARTYPSFEEFLYDSPTQTCEFQYRLGERLIGVSLADHWPGGLSSVFMYFDPDFATRSLGTYSVLWEIAHCRRHRVPYYYLGFYVAGSGKMSYKSRFRPNEILAGDPPRAAWVRFRE